MDARVKIGVTQNGVLTFRIQFWFCIPKVGPQTQRNVCPPKFEHLLIFNRVFPPFEAVNLYGPSS